MRTLAGFLLVVISSISLASGSGLDKVKNVKKMKDLKDDPICKKIHDECKAKGYEMGAHKKNGMGMMVDCIAKVAKGETIEGVTSTQAEASACREAIKGKK